MAVTAEMQRSLAVGRCDKVAEELLNRQLAVQAKKSKERSQLNEKNEARDRKREKNNLENNS